MIESIALSLAASHTHPTAVWFADACHGQVNAMPVTSAIVVHDPIDAYELFAVARTVLALPPDGRWQLCDFGTVHMPQTLPGQNTPALAAVYFPPRAGDPYLEDPDSTVPPGYAHLSFNTDGTDRRRHRRRHHNLIDRAGEWLTAQTNQLVVDLSTFAVYVAASVHARWA